MSPDAVFSASILIVDDEPTNVLVLQAHLERAGYVNIDATSDPQLVVGMCRDKQYDLVLLDLNMPILNGFQIMDHFSRMDCMAGVPVLVVTAMADLETRVRALQAGANDYVTKPFERQEVLARIRNLISVRLLEIRLRNQNELLEKKVRERTWELYASRLDIIRRLGRAAEYRLNNAGIHSESMSHIAACIARSAGLDDAVCDMILQASPMHDVGMIGLPDRVVLKPGALDHYEREVVERHTVIGADLLSGSPSPLLQMAKTIANWHHERWDGTGYPSGLIGEEIPLVARIVAIADVYDALTAERVYRPAWGHDEAARYIRAQSGKYFDPSLVDAFERARDSIVVIKRQFERTEHDGVSF